MDSPKQPPHKDRPARLNDVVSETMRRRQRGEILSDRQVIDAHPDLAPELEQRLEALRAVEHDHRQSTLETTIALDPLAPNQVIGSYHIRSRLGQGGFGEVYLAEQTEPVRRHVALKVIRRFWDSPEFIARFEDERQVLALLDHPNVAKVFDGGRLDDGRPYMVMEYVRGLPITEHCDKQRLNIDDRLLRLYQAWPMPDKISEWQAKADNLGMNR